MPTTTNISNLVESDHFVQELAKFKSCFQLLEVIVTNTDRHEHEKQNLNATQVINIAMHIAKASM